MYTTKELNLKAVQIRRLLLGMIYEGKSGHTGGSLSSADILVSLFYHKMRHNSKNPKWPERDRFLLSKGHSVEAYYCVLADVGYFPTQELKTFSKFKSRLIGHPNKDVPGVEMNTGSLGHGLSVGVGMAIAAKKAGINNKIYALMGDGELAEGSIWEGAMAASHYKLDNLVGIIDRNGLQISGNTEDVMAVENLEDKWKAFGWDVMHSDGNNIHELCAVLDKTDEKNGKPHLIIARTTKGKGISYMENIAKWHHGVPTKEQLKIAYDELDKRLKELESDE
ncbi:MAG TPA: transketolase [Clostridia bacterium]|nr:transketolase [Clostridia bacterium]